jgi:hypothetical protein
LALDIGDRGNLIDSPYEHSILQAPVVNELSRLVYLDAMGIDSYISRFQLPGARTTQRLAVVPDTPASPEPGTGEHQRSAATRTGGAPTIERIPVEQPRRESPTPRLTTPAASSDSPPRFSLATIVAGGWLWVEELQGIPLAREQVQLVQSMANALQQADGGQPSGQEDVTSRPDIAQFDWPMHNNQQLDLGEAAARAALASFLGRKIEQQRLGLVLLGPASARRVQVAELACPRVALSYSTVAMLDDPSLKRPVWTELKSILRRD